jgi:tetratricopeptide (TPR) repeat protein
LSAERWTQLGLYYTAIDHYADAHDALDRALEITPKGGYPLNTLCKLYLLEGKPDRMRDLAERIEFEPLRLRNLALAEFALGRAADAAHHLAELTHRYPERDAYQIAQVYAWQGDANAAFAWLGHAFEVRDAGLGFIQYDPLMTKIRPDPRYAALLQTLGLHPVTNP